MYCIEVNVIGLRFKVKLVCQSSTSVSGYNEYTIGWSETKICVWVDIDQGYQMVQG